MMDLSDTYFSFRCSAFQPRHEVFEARDIGRSLEKRQVTCNWPNTLIHLCINDIYCEVFCIPPNACTSTGRAINNPANKFAAYGDANWCHAFT